MRRDEGGYIVVETVMCFMLFVLLMASILSLISIVTVQARINYALTQTAETISMYGYVLEAAGAAEHVGNIDKNAAEAQGEIDKFNENFERILNAIQRLDINEIGSRGQALANQGENLASDPERVVHMLLSYGTDMVMGLGLQEVARAMMERYLANGNMGGSAYLRSPGVFSSKPDPVMDGVSDLVFFVADLSGDGDSTLLSSEGDVKLVVEYKMDYAFGALPLPFKDGLSFHQEAATRMWLGGSGDGYKG